MNFDFDFERVKGNKKTPYTQREFLKTLVETGFNGLDIFEKIKPRNQAEREKILVEEETTVDGVNTKITFAVLDRDNDVDDTTLEIFYYNRILVSTAKVKGLPSYPPVKGGNFDVPVNTAIDKKHVADCLTDLLWVEVKPENILENDFRQTTKPYTEVTCTLVNHPVYIGEVKLIFYSPEDSRPLIEFELGQVTTETGSSETHVNSYATMSLSQPANKFERDVIRNNVRFPIYLGASYGN